MAKEVRLPQLGETMDTGTVVNCLVKVGDEVKKGDIIFEIETDKATLEMESPAGGFVKHILAAVDQTLPVGAPMLVLGGKEEDVPQSFVDSLAGGAPAEAPPSPSARVRSVTPMTASATSAIEDQFRNVFLMSHSSSFVFTAMTVSGAAGNPRFRTSHAS